MRKSLDRRFWSKVDIGPPDDCWLWQAGRDDHGYGRFKPVAGSSPKKASRMAWMLFFGKDAGDLLVCHRCDNPPCCNPWHLFLGAHLDNSRDMMAKGRGPDRRPGEIAAFVERVRRLTDLDIAEARRRVAGGESYRSVGRRLGVAHTTILRLVNGTHWRDSSTPRSG